MTITEIKEILKECQEKIRAIPSDVVSSGFQDEIIRIESLLRRSLSTIRLEERFTTKK